MILETYRRLHARSAELSEQAQQRFPNGVTHDARYTPPFPLYVERSSGARKWDADENELIDFVTGHGSLILGHGHPDVVAAVQEQMPRGTHLGAESPLALRWGELVQSMFPSVERLRFTASGTEATMLGLRLARAFTGRQKIVRFVGHYHGWHDLLARDTEADVPVGVPDGLRDSTIVVQADLNQIEATLRSDHDIAALILEPTGASYGMVPLSDEFLHALRQLTEAHGVLLIFDEVVTGFRVRPGGVQERTGIRADMTSFAKILAGGLPGGAIGGRADIFRHLEFADAAWAKHKIRHNGTFNANPLSAVAGITTLNLLKDGAVSNQVCEMAELLTAGMNALFRKHELRGWAAYSDGSIFHIVADIQPDFAPGELPTLDAASFKRGGNPQKLALMRMALINHGVDLMRGRSGFLSKAHTPADIELALKAFDLALTDIRDEG